MASCLFIAALSGLLLGWWWPPAAAYFRRRYPTYPDLPSLAWQPWEPVCGMAVGVLLAIWLPNGGLSAWAAWGFAVTVILSARIDLACGVLAYRFSAGLAAGGWALQWWFGTGPDAMLASGLTAAALGMIAWLSHGGMGRGDVWFAAGIAGWFSLTEAWAFLCLAFGGGALVGIGWLVLGGRNRRAALPFGPFLAWAGITVMWFAERMGGWYEYIFE